MERIDSDDPTKKSMSTKNIEVTKDIEQVDFSKIDNYKKNILLWSLYDLANTVYSMGIVSLVLVPFVTIISIASIAGIEPSSLIDGSSNVTEAQFTNGVNRANFFYSTVVFIGNMVMAAISPILGAYADTLSKRKYLLSLLTMFCLISIWAIAWQLTLFWVLIVFLIANLAYQMSLVVYDSMIPFIAKPEHTSKVSGFGVSFGYFGSFVAIGIAFFMGSNGRDYILDDEELIIKIGYIPEYIPIVALAFLVLGFPILFTSEARTEYVKKSFNEIIDDTFIKLKQTAKEIWSYKDTRYFMIGWLLFVDTANTVIAFMSILITLGLGLPENMVLIVLGIGIASAVLFTFPVGWLGDKIGPKKNFAVVGSLWILALLLGFFSNLTIGAITTPEELTFIMAVIVGPALGGTWVCQRQMLSELAPKDRTSNYFGIANVFGRISSALGPYVWTAAVFVLTTFLGYSAGFANRLTIFVILFLLILGLAIIWQVEDHHEDYVNGHRHVGDGVWMSPEQRE